MKLSNSRDLAIYMAYFASSGGGEDNYSDVYDAFTNKPNAATKSAQQNFVNSITSAGIWEKLDGLWVFATHSNDDGEALINWVSPSGTAATAVNSPTFTQYEGIETNGTNSYINLQYNPTTDATNFKQNDGVIGAYSNTNTENNGDWDMGAVDGSNGWSAMLFYASGVNIGRINCLSSISGVETDGSGLLAVIRRANDEIVNNKNGVDVISSVLIASAGITNRDFYVGCLNNGTPAYHSNRQYGMAFVGGALSEAEMASFYSAYNTYKTAITPAAPAATSYMEDSEGNRVKDSEGSDIIIP